MGLPYGVHRSCGTRKLQKKVGALHVIIAKATKFNQSRRVHHSSGILKYGHLSHRQERPTLSDPQRQMLTAVRQTAGRPNNSLFVSLVSDGQTYSLCL